MNIKKIAVMAMTGILALGVTGCGGSNTSDGKDEIAKTQDDKTQMYVGTKDDYTGEQMGAQGNTGTDTGADIMEDTGADADADIMEDTGADTGTDIMEDTGADTGTGTQEEIGADIDLEAEYVVEVIGDVPPTSVGMTGGTMFPYAVENMEAGMLKYMPKDLVRLARNEIYAKHGYIFESEDLISFFLNKEWYEESISRSEWKDSMLNDIERENVKALAEYEKKDTMTVFDVTKKDGKLLLTDGEISLTVPGDWDADNYFFTKYEDPDYVLYTLYAKNNFKYGFGGVVFSIEKCVIPVPGDVVDNLIELGKDGEYYYTMYQTTDSQHCHTNGALQGEWELLNGAYQDIADSFTIE